MSRLLLEAAEDLELAVIKALNGAELSVEEIDELRTLTVRDLMAEHDLDYLMADRVLRHVQAENLRMNAHNLSTPIPGYEDEETSMTRTFPMNEIRVKSPASFNALLRRLINE